MIQKFYNAQKTQGLLFAFIGFLSLLLSIFLLYDIYNELCLTYYGFALGVTISLLMVGFFQVYIGINSYVKTPKHLLLVQSFVKENHSAMVNIEIPAIEKKIKKNKLYINIFLALIAIAVLFIFVLNNYFMLSGIGIGLFIQSLISIAAYYFANQRSQIYFKWLNDYYN